MLSTKIADVVTWKAMLFRPYTDIDTDVVTWKAMLSRPYTDMDTDVVT